MSCPEARFCSDAELGYMRSRTRFQPGAGLALDEAYRLAHLPLVAPTHPGVIPSREGTGYAMGVHPRVFSLVVPVPYDALARSDAYRALDQELRSAPFARKLAWPVLARRAGKLHATVCGSLGTGAPPSIGPAMREALSRIGPVRVEVRGLFSGNVNIGRLYLKLYPECRAGENVFRAIQRAMGRRETALYVVGIHNLVDDLDPREAAALLGTLDKWWDRPMLRLSVDTLWLLGASDDLVLDSEVVDRVWLTKQP